MVLNVFETNLEERDKQTQNNFQETLKNELEKRFSEQRQIGINIGFIGAYLGVAKYLKSHTKKDAIEYFSKQAELIQEKTGLKIE